MLLWELLLLSRRLLQFLLQLLVLGLLRRTLRRLLLALLQLVLLRRLQLLLPQLLQLQLLLLLLLLLRPLLLLKDRWRAPGDSFVALLLFAEGLPRCLRLRGVRAVAEEVRTSRAMYWAHEGGMLQVLVLGSAPAAVLLLLHAGWHLGPVDGGLGCLLLGAKAPAAAAVVGGLATAWG